mgnify:CR=1 FL=1
MINVYVSAWGEWEIPDEIYGKTIWREEPCTSWVDGEKSIKLEAAAIPENGPFFKWIKKQELEAVKPN